MTAHVRKLLFATNNAHKLAEVQAALGPDSGFVETALMCNVTRGG